MVTHNRKPVSHNEFRSEKIVHDIGQEVGVLVVAEQRQIHDNAQNHNGFPAKVSFHTGQSETCQIVIDNHEPKQNQEQSARLVVEKQADKEQEGIPKHDLVLENAQKGQHDGEERPEIELGEQQRVSLIKREQVLEKVSGNVPKSHHLPFFKCSTYLSINALNSRSPTSS